MRSHPKCCILLYNMSRRCFYWFVGFVCGRNEPQSKPQSVWSTTLTEWICKDIQMNKLHQLLVHHCCPTSDNEWQVILIIKQIKGMLKSMHYMAVLKLLIACSPMSEEQLGIAAKGVVPNNTLCSTCWAETNFLAWVVECNKTVS